MLTPSILTKNNTLEIKGFAILCMMFYHLFAFPERIPESIILPWMGSSIIKSLQICVSIYLFMAGYGLQCSIINNGPSIHNCLNKLKRLYINYWWAILPFIIIGISIHYYSLNFKTLILNLIGLASTYNGEWWFYSLYVELLIIFYIILARLNLNFKQYTVFMVSLLTIIGIIYIFVPFNLSITWERHLFLIIRNINICILGCYFAKFDIFRHIIKKHKIKYLYTFFIIVPLLIRGFISLTIIADLLLLPIFIIGVINLPVQLSRILQYIGKHSMNIWLIHSFFIYYYLKDIAFITSNPIIIFLTVILCSLTCSITINYIKCKISHLIKIFV